MESHPPGQRGANCNAPPNDRAQLSLLCVANGVPDDERHSRVAYLSSTGELPASDMQSEGFRNEIN